MVKFFNIFKIWNRIFFIVIKAKISPLSCVNYFNKQINKARSANKRETRLFDYMKQRFEEEEDDCAKDGVGEEILELEETLVGADMFGQTFDSITRREFELKTQNNDGANLFKLYTVKGQLGSGDEPESDPITC